MLSHHEQYYAVLSSIPGYLYGKKQELEIAWAAYMHARKVFDNRADDDTLKNVNGAFARLRRMMKQMEKDYGRTA